MFEEELKKFGDIIKIDNFQEECIKYADYLDYIVEFNGTKEDISLVLQKYKDSITKMILSSDKLKDKIMTDKNGCARHDIDFDNAIDFQKIIDNIFEKNNDGNLFAENARRLIIFEIAKMIKVYGMEELNSNYDKISKEVGLGVLNARTDWCMPQAEKEKIEKRVELSEKYGEEAIPYLEDYDLLKQRVSLLKRYVETPEEKQKVISILRKLKLVEFRMENQNGSITELLKESFSDYEKVNREMLISRIRVSDESVIDNPDDKRFMLLHFIPDKSSLTDIWQDNYFEEAINEWIKETISSKYGREYDPEIDAKETQEIMEHYKETRRNPFDLKSRIPFKNRYANDSFQNVITKSFTDLSCSVARNGDLQPHLGRKIAMGFTRIPTDAITTINLGYNNKLDRPSFENTSVAFPEILSQIIAGGTNETLLDWTKVEPAYIMVWKDTEELSEELVEEAEEYKRLTGLPIKVYDYYAMEKNMTKSKEHSEDGVIEGAYSSKSLEPFAALEQDRDIVMNIHNMIKEQGVVKDDRSDK